MMRVEGREPSDRTAGSTGQEPIAVVGIGCRFAQSATPDAFWQNLVAGMDAIVEVPKDRFDIDALYDPRPAVPGRSVTRWGSFIDDAHAFDNAFFRLSPREARRMDPQQRVLLEVAAEALDDACLSERALAEFRTGVFIGSCYNDWETHTLGDPDRIDLYTCTGATRCTLSGRISFAFNLQGPSMTVDAGCASSLLSIHLACQSLWTGETSFALAGGVNLILEPGWTIGFSQAQMLSPDGHCKAFDSRGNGFVRADGCGVVALMPLSRAARLGAPTYALIRGSGASNDGATNGLLATPSAVGQANALHAAYRSAGLSPHDVQYIETHGTGTAAGDPVEVAAISSVMHGRAEPCLIGSVKTNIGHTEGAAGVAGFIKTCLALQHRMIPATLHFQQANPKIDWDGSVAVADSLQPWPQGVPRAGVSSFGISGTDVHVVLEACQASGVDQHPEDPVGPLPLCLSSTSQEGLEANAAAHVEALSAANAPTFARVCETAALGRNHQVHRLVVLAHDRDEARRNLQVFLSGEAADDVVRGRVTEHARGPVFVFAGQGSQWAGMGAQLLEQEPVFRAALAECDRALQPYTPVSVVELLQRRDEAELQSIDIIQPTLFAVQVGLSALWRALGVEPSLVIGHSMGEIAAAHLAGVLSLDDAARVVCSRSQLLKLTSGQGGMLAVELSFEDAERAVAPFAGKVGIAVSNSPSATVLSGEPALLQQLQRDLERQEVFCRFIAADVAGHSPQLDPLLPKLAEALSAVRPLAPGGVPMFSTVNGRMLAGHDCDASYWVRNLREPVRFSSSLQALIAQGYDTFVEISPHPILLGPIRQLLDHAGRPGSVHETMRRDDDARACVRRALAALHTLGHEVDFAKLFGPRRAFVKLPPYAWQRERFDVDAGDVDRVPQRGARALAPTRGGGLLGPGLKSAVHGETYFFEGSVSHLDFPYLGDHRVRDAALLPAAAYVDMSLTAAEEVFDGQPMLLEQLRFDQALPLPDGETTQLQLIVTVDPRGASFKFFGGRSATGRLTPVAALRARRADASAEQEPRFDLAELRAGLSPWPADEHFKAARAHGIEYGPGFRGLRELWMGGDTALGRVTLPASVPVDSQRQRAHGALLDACWQVFAALLFRDGAEDGAADAFLPVRVERVSARRPLGIEVWAHAVRRRDHGNGSRADAASPPERVCGDLVLCDAEGTVLMEVTGFEVQRLARRTPGQELDDWLYEVSWQAAPARDDAAQNPRAREGETWLVLAERGGRTSEAVVRGLAAAGASSVVVHPGSEFEANGPDRFAIDARQPDHLARVLSAVAAGGRTLAGVVHLWSLEGGLDDESAAALDRSQQLSCLGLTHLVQTLIGAGSAGRTLPLWIVTRGAHRVLDPDAIDPTQAPIWALARVLRYEHAELRTRCIDLSQTSGQVEVDALVRELASPANEDELALRAGQRLVARLVRGVGSAPERQPLDRVAGAGNFRLEIDRPGILDHLELRTAARPAPGPSEVEIEVHHAALNFLDVMKAMGNYPGQDGGPVALGLECAGHIRRVGANVQALTPGQAVVAVTHAARTALGRHVITDAALVMPKPDRLSFEQAVTLPVAFLTAHYALSHVGRMARGERVLIHSAAGGVGLAALQLARAAGAEIFATAGNDEKRRIVRELGATYAGDSRSLAFAAEIAELTRGEGVDLVLNSLAQDAISEGLGLLRAHGRFLEIGKRDIHENLQLGLLPFKDALSFAHIDVARLLQERPGLMGQMLRELLERVAHNELEPLPATVFPASQAADAFRYMAQGAHVGKVVLSFDDPALAGSVRPGASVPLATEDGSYLITGGLGGLGLETATWLVEQGARQLWLLGRGAARGQTEQAAEAIAKLRAAGAEVGVLGCDVGDREQLAAALEQVACGGRPLRGIVHAAGVLDDGLMQQLTAPSLERVMRPKLHGAFNLHLLTRELPLDFFVLYSSGAATLGSPGQGNYAAANAFMDALAHHRRVLGLPALSINWGPWREVGLAVRPDRAQRLGERGLGSMSNRQGLRVLDRLLRCGAVNTAVFPAADWRKWAEFYPVAARLPMFELLLKQAGSHAPAAQASILQRIQAASPDERAGLLEGYLLEQVRRVLKVSGDRQLDPQLALTRLGIDSLMALELKNRIEADLHAVVPVSKILLGPSARKLALDLLDKLPHGTPELEATLSPVDALSDAQVDALLGDLLGTQSVHS